MLKSDHEDNVLREELIQAELKYRESSDPEAKAQYLRLFRAFKDFVLYGKAPAS